MTEIDVLECLFCRWRSRIAAALCAALPAAALAQAQSPQAPASYPVKPVRILVGFAAGGGIDTTARIAAQRMSESLGQPFVVDNRPGASGTIAAAQVAKAPPDGYTLLMTADVHAITPNLVKDLPFDAIRDFAAVGTVLSGPQCFAAHPAFPPRSLPELIALAKARPEAIAYASPGSGTLAHVAMELFRSMAGIRLAHIAYKGSASSGVAVMGGEVPLLTTGLGQAIPHAKAGRLRILAVTSAQRTPFTPEIASVAEVPGLAGYEAIAWQGLLAPAGTPAAIVSLLNAQIDRLLRQQAVLEQLAARAWVAYPRTPSAFAELIAKDVAKWAKVIQEAGLKTE